MFGIMPLVAKSEERTIQITEVEGKRRVSVKKGSLYHRVPSSVYRWLNANSLDDFLHAEFVITKDGKHALLLQEAKED